MHNILIAGGGKIGSTIAHLLARSEQYEVTLADCKLDHAKHHFGTALPPNITLAEINITDKIGLAELTTAKKVQSVLSCLPYFCNQSLAQFAHDNNLNYFDLTEDRDTADFIRQLAKK